jgi:mRNA interferase HicA
MKRIDLIRHLERNGAQFLREGSDHSCYVNRKSGKVSTVPRHRERNERSCELGNILRTSPLIPFSVAPKIASTAYGSEAKASKNPNVD